MHVLDIYKIPCDNLEKEWVFMHGKIFCNCSIEHLDEIKFMSLYFDSFEIIRNNIIETEPELDFSRNMDARISKIFVCVTDDFEKEIDILVNENIATYCDIKNPLITVYNKTSADDEIPREIGNIILEDIYKLMDEYQVEGTFHSEPRHLESPPSIAESNKFFHYEGREIHSNFFDDLSRIRVGTKIYFNHVRDFYFNILFYILSNFALGHNTINTLSVIDEYMNKYYRKKTNKSNYSPAFLGIEALKLFLPNVSTLNFNEILELRHNLKDELISYRHYMNELSDKLRNDLDVDENNNTISMYLEKKIEPAINELKNNIIKSKYSISSNFVKELKDPKSYVPFLASIFYDLPTQYAAFLSLGIISIQSLFDWKAYQTELKNNGLYYFLKIDKYLPKK